eukprot:gb/GEZN01008003.1/.p1 GENE.gb/GEZN01008003.1/~~gb/GEZN01008003.1/.p1  ORF type:complete len:461 (+),score=46.54 gb/GEZN01008003.1/:50-1432(+)
MGFVNFIFLLIESPQVIVGISVGVSSTICWVRGYGWIGFFFFLIAFPITFVLVFIACLMTSSRMHDGGLPTANLDDYITFKNKADKQKYAGQKMPMGDLYEMYISEKLDFKQDVYETLLQRHKLFRMTLTLENIMFYLRTFMATNFDHSQKADHGDIAHVYNRGNDFYSWFLGETMVYTSGIFRDESETLEEAQKRKLDTVCKYMHMKEGDIHLDIGCGWGTFVAHSAKNYGTISTGVTLAKEQAAFGMDRAKEYKVESKVKILTMDYREIPFQKYDKISVLEMAEHVGIKNFQKFLKQVKGMLKDDGLFYLQIAGLRRAWQWEDLVWGLFMGKYIFPGADASCPLGFVTSQLEKAGFEVHRVENCGVHYSLTISRWYENWKKNEKAIVGKYKQYWFRMWMMFLAWSTIIAAQGSSTVFMITCNKNLVNDKKSVAKDEVDAQPLSRMGMWVGKEPIATQQ